MNKNIYLSDNERAHDLAVHAAFHDDYHALIDDEKQMHL